LREGEEARLLAACDLGRNRWLKPLIILALETAMRRGELVGLLWEHVDLEKRVAHLPQTKNGDSRDVPLSQRATATLATLAQDRGDRKLVLPLSGNATRLAWEHLRVRAECDGLHFHDLRHEAVSRLFERGLNVVEVAAISGHRELKMLQRYTHLRAVDLVARLG
jgi:integrase